MKYKKVVSSLLVTSMVCITFFIPAQTHAQAATDSDGAPTVDVAADPQTDNNRSVTSNEVAESLSAIPSITEESSDVVTTSDSDSAIVATMPTEEGGDATTTTTIDIPKNPEDGVTLAGNGAPAIEISLPNAAAASDATVVADGTVAYPATNGSASAVQVTEDGGVRMLTIIDNATAPTEYPYTVTVPNGGRIELTEDGGAIVLDSTGQALAIINIPWAKDANGLELQTWFTTDGHTLTQHIIHTIEGVVYPVNADPSVSWSWGSVTIYFSKSETSRISIFDSWPASLVFLPFKLTGVVAGYVGWQADRIHDRGQCMAYTLQTVHFRGNVVQPGGGSVWGYRCQ